MSIARAFKLPMAVIRVSGQDKLSYLHGQVTQDINLIKDDNFMWSGHCSPKGKLWSVARLTRYQDDYVLLSSEAETQASLKELQKYGVFAKVDITAPNCHVFGLLCEDEGQLLNHFQQDPNSTASAFDVTAGKLLRVAPGRFVLIAFDDLELGADITLEDDPSPFIAAGILAAEPQLNAEHIDEFVPQMVNLQALNGISFKKGCYTGQETVARMRYLGKNKRAMFVVSGTADAPLQESDLELQVGDNWRRGGKVIQQCFDKSNSTYYALAVMPNDTAADAVLRAKNTPEVSLTIQPLPYSLEND